MRAPIDTESVGRVRTRMADDLMARGLGEELVEDAQIVVTELLTNAFRHAHALSDGTMRVRWKVRPESLEIEVTDGGSPTTPLPAPRGVWRDSGRGLRVVRALAHEWGSGEDRTGHVVWACLGGPSRRRVG
ncbi:MAG: ATP-binding protein [Ornithinibacter sp.]